MSNTYSWKIIAINNQTHDSYTGVVTLAQWELWADDGANRAMLLGQSEIAIGDLSQGYIPRDQLSESDVLSWVASSFTEQSLADTLAEVDRRLRDQSQTLSVRLPWAPITVALTDEQSAAVSAAQNIINVDNNP